MKATPHFMVHLDNGLIFLSPAMAKPLGGDMEMLGMRPSVTKLVSAITLDFMHRFTQYLTQ